MKYVKVIDGAVDSVALERPGTFQEVLGEDDTKTVEFIPDPDYFEAPDDVFGGDVYDGKAFAPPAKEPEAAPTTVSARQFKLQLEIQGLTPTVEGWVATQSKLIQIAYDNSGAFERDEPMLQAGFKALGFTGAALDAFYVEAAKL